jgi:hypothetical protein
MAQVTENFGSDLTAWTQLTGAWSIISGELQAMRSGGSNENGYIRHDTPMDSADHQATVSNMRNLSVGSTTHETGVTVRGNASNHERYQGELERVATDSYQLRILKFSTSNGRTTLVTGSPFPLDDAYNVAITLQVDGTTLTLSLASPSQQVQVMDSSIASGTYTGIGARLFGNFRDGWDNFESADLSLDIEATTLVEADGVVATTRVKNALGVVAIESDASVVTTGGGARDVEATVSIAADARVATQATRNIPIMDTFANANGTLLQNHVATGDGGGFTWTLIDTTPGGLSIQGNQLLNGGTANLRWYRAERDLSSPNQRANLTIVAWNEGSNRIDTGLLVRMESDANPDCYLAQLRIRDGIHDVRIYSRINGILTLLAGPAFVAWNPGDVLGFEAVGDLMTIYQGSTPVLAVFDTALPDGLRVGIERNADTSTPTLNADNFEAFPVTIPAASSAVAVGVEGAVAITGSKGGLTAVSVEADASVAVEYSTGVKVVSNPDVATTGTKAAFAAIAVEAIGVADHINRFGTVAVEAIAKVMTGTGDIGDTFDDVDGTELQDHIATGITGGFGWTAIAGPEHMTIQGNELDLGQVAGISLHQADVPLNSTNHFAEVNVTEFDYSGTPVDPLTNPGFEGDLTGWTEDTNSGITGTAVRTTGEFYAGAGSLEIEITASANEGDRLVFQDIAAEEGQVWNAFCRVKGNGLSNAEARLLLVWFNAVGVTQVDVVATTDISGDWVVLEHINKAAPPETVTLRIEVQVHATQAGGVGTAYFDDVRAYEASSPQANLGLLCRKNASLQTYYLGELRRVYDAFYIVYSKVFDGGAIIGIGDPVPVLFVPPEIFKFEVKPLAMTNELRAYIGNMLQDTVEDNDIHGNLRVGIRGEANNVGFAMVVDDFQSQRLPDVVKESTIAIEAEAAGALTGQRSGWFQAVVISTGAKGAMGATEVISGGAVHNHRATTARFGVVAIACNGAINVLGDAQMFAVGTRNIKGVSAVVDVEAEGETAVTGVAS